MSAYYNEIDPFAVQWLRNLIAAGHIASGEVDNRSITEVQPEDLRGYTQCHFFAGIGVWSYGLRLAGWDDARYVWTGSCPCQPFSVAGAGEGFDDQRHLWPTWFGLISECRPPVVFGEQVESAIRHGWLDLVSADLESIGYAVGAVGLPAASVGAPHIRNRLWFVADAYSGQCDGASGSLLSGRIATDSSSAIGELGHSNDARLEGHRRGHQAEGGHREGAIRPARAASESGSMADTATAGRELIGRGRFADARETRAHADINHEEHRSGYDQWSDCDWLPCRDGKARPVEPGTFPLVNGASSRVGRLRAYGNAIVPQVAAEVIHAYMECRP